MQRQAIARNAVSRSSRRDGRTTRASSFPSWRKTSVGHNFTPSYTYDEQEAFEGVLAWISAHDDGQGRWLIQDQTLGENVMGRTQAQVIGGFLVRNIEHSDANWFRRVGGPPDDPAVFAEYLQT